MSWYPRMQTFIITSYDHDIMKIFKYLATLLYAKATWSCGDLTSSWGLGISSFSGPLILWFSWSPISTNTDWCMRSSTSRVDRIGGRDIVLALIIAEFDWRSSSVKLASKIAERLMSETWKISFGDINWKKKKFYQFCASLVTFTTRLSWSMLAIIDTIPITKEEEQMCSQCQ